MSIDKAKLELLLLDQAHEWLEHFDKIDLHLSSQLLIPQMQQALSRGNHAEVRCFIERLIDLSTKIQNNSSAGDLEPSIIRIECALAAYQMKNYNEAIKLLETAIQVDRGAKERHLEGTIKCMLGCIQWQLSNQGDNAIISWEDTIKIYRELQKLNSDTHVITRSTWYSVRLAEIKTVLEGALEPSEPTYSSESSEKTPSATITQPPPTSTGDALRLFYVIEEVQAGSFGRVATNPNLLGHVQMEQCHINGLAHYIVNLRGTGKVIKISWDKNYGVIKVSGESMNARGIDNGDYVLLHFQKNAEHGDIVASQIMEIEAEATLKIFLKRENNVILQFCSKNPMYQEGDGRSKEFEFTEADESFQIVGVAIAVFKPI